MKREKKLQYTIRSVPASVDRALRGRAREEGKSLNQTALEALTRAAGIGPKDHVYTDLDDLIGTWEEDPKFDRAIADQDLIDPRLWQ